MSIFSPKKKFYVALAIVLLIIIAVSFVANVGDMRDAFLTAARWATPFNTPTGLTATVSGSGTSVNLSWTDTNAGAIGYTIQRGLVSTGLSTIATTASGAQSYTDTTVKAGTSYQYRIRASSSGFKHTSSDWTSPVQVSIPAPIATYTVNATVSPAGSGTITGLNTNNSYSPGYFISSMTAVPATGYTFTSWTDNGVTSTNNPKSLLVNENHTIVANFTAVVATSSTQYSIGTSQTGTGSGTVFCGTTWCPDRVNPGTVLTFTATPASGSVFAGWGGACSGTPVTSNTCTLTINAPTNVSGVFNLSASSDTTPPIVSLTAPSGTVTGSVTISATANDNVGVAGVTFKVDGTTVSLEDTTAPYSVSWNTQLTSDGAHTITAVAKDAAGNQTTSNPVTVTVSNTVTPVSYSITVTKSGTGAGTVTSGGGSINCGTACSTTAAAGQSVTLTAAPTASSTFTSWSGISSCSTSATCTFTVNATTTATANFTLNPPPTTAGTYYVSPSGTASGNGSITSPWNLQTALNQPSVVAPGSTIWVRGGTYSGVFTSRLAGTASNRIIVRNYNNERVILSNPTPTYKTTLNVSGSYTSYWGLEFTSTDTSRSLGSATYPSSAAVDTSAGTGNKFINLIIHDSGMGLGAWQYAVDTEVYGSLIYYNGWDKNHDHGVYVQNAAPSTKYFKDNLIFHNANTGGHFYGTDGPVDNISLTGNVFFGNGEIFPSTGGRNLYVGGYNVIARSPILQDNFTYRAPALHGNSTSDFDLGGDLGSTNAIATNNYLVGSNLWNKNTGLSLSNNFVYGPTFGISPASYTGNTWTTTKPSANKIVVRPNQYESGRANVVVYNWQNLSTVSVNVSSVAAAGSTYELHNVTNYYGDILTGTVASDGTISIPMTGHTVSAPVGMSAPSSLFPEFGAFVFIKTGTSTTPPPPPPTTTINCTSTGPNFCVSPTATGSGDGSTANPWSLQQALGINGSNNPKITPGVTVWLRGGEYHGRYNTYINGGSAAAPVTFRPYPGERAIIANDLVDGSPSIQLNGTASYLTFRDLEFTHTGPFNRASTQTGSWPTDISTNGATSAYPGRTGIKFINLIVHDNGGTAIGTSVDANDTEVYGNLIYYNGWSAPDRTHGHGLYQQNKAPSKSTNYDNLLVYNANQGAQFYGTVRTFLDNGDYQGNIFVNNGGLFNKVACGKNSDGSTYYPDTCGRNFDFGSGGVVNNATIKNNFSYRTPLSDGTYDGTSDFSFASDGSVGCSPSCSVSLANLGLTRTYKAIPDPGSTFLGWGGSCSGTNTTCTVADPATVSASFSTVGTVTTSIGGNSAVIENNYFVGSNQWAANMTNISIKNNTIVGPAYMYLAQAGTAVMNTLYKPVITGNTFYNKAYYVEQMYPTNTSGNTYAVSNSGYVYGTKPTENKVFVRPNTHETGRANIVIYNWSKSPSVSVPISGIGLNAGEAYELHSALNYFGDVVMGTTTSSGSITICMLNCTPAHTVAQPVSISTTPVNTFPEFGAFVIRKAYRTLADYK